MVTLTTIVVYKHTHKQTQVKRVLGNYMIRYTDLDNLSGNYATIYLTIMLYMTAFYRFNLFCFISWSV
jgi:hypothetical protein